ncbi:branched-chain amino acid ABC transporter ATP-binding protein/permease [Aquabacter spiritensis]|uniref:Monosaccharide ABC transporter ATP-binding protein (CUT2 family) n=1 Tax=Aquabacter spiritensis TaxID=933073 RepID=A0A4R3LTS5_9HYPH|nr:branched-chain amino acid ABC transporter ATP-binding protein/permease [Aquabacter spiritensis]TCT03904.1 monosaccharide ABC transporter ATP-binding protein (CUT2 family) [Aquabacter spiritensis]
MGRFALPASILAGAALVAAYAFQAESYTLFVIALVALTAIVGVGLNILLGLAGQVSLGHVGFYAIGAYVSGILILKGWDFFAALPLAVLVAGAIGALLALPALRVSGPYLAMVTIAFAFIVEHGLIEWRDVTGGANGLMGILPPTLGPILFAEREMALLAILLATLALLGFWGLSESRLGRAMRAVRDSEIAAQSVGLNPVGLKTLAFALSAALAGLAGAVFAPLMMFISPGSFPFSQSILFLFAVVVGGAGSVLGPVFGALVVVGLPELLSDFAEYRLLVFGGLLLVVLWIAPEGIVGLARRLMRQDPRPAQAGGIDVAAALRPAAPSPLAVAGLGIAFGGVKAASDVAFTAQPGAVTSVIGPNGAGKTTVLNMIGGFYKPDAGTIRLAGAELAGAPAYKVARAGIARTYQTTQLFGTLSVRDNVRIAGADPALAEALLAFVGYGGPVAARADDLPHVDRRLVEIARALATRPRVLLLDEPAAGLMRADKDALGALLRRIAETGIAVILVEHDMAMVMGISDHVVVLDAGRPIAAGTPDAVRADPKVVAAYLGGTETRARRRAVPWSGPADPVLATLRLSAGYGAAPVLENVEIAVRPGELVALLGANGAGKSTAMKAVSGLLRPVSGEIVLRDAPVSGLPAHRIARLGLALVPEGRQVFPELTVRDNIRLGASARAERPDAAAFAAELDVLLRRFPRLAERLSSRAGLLSGGEQQMLALARGLMAKPQILLLDEPSLGLAPAIINEVFDVLAELRAEGVTILLVDQMAALALTVADRAYVLESGRVVQAGSAADLAGDATLEAAYLGARPAAQ